jgi:hypothetical protein
LSVRKWGPASKWYADCGEAFEITCSSDVE